MSTYRLTIEYNGATFSGWQAQEGIRTVQGEVEHAISTILRKPIRVQGAGRTDAGVHALAQTASFEADTDVSVLKMRHGMCALLRPDAAVVEAQIAPEGFNARFDAAGKHYRYTALSRLSPSPLHCHNTYHVYAPLDVELMREGAAFFVGTHDFAGFRAANCGREKTVRKITEVSVSKDDFGLIDINVKGTAFLKNMVRIMAGTLIEIGKGRLKPGIIPEILESKERRQAGPTAPARGLTMVEVYYPDGWIRQR